MDLVEEEDDTSSLLFGRFADRDKDVGQVFGETAGVGDSFQRLDIAEACGKLALGAEREL